MSYAAQPMNDPQSKHVRTIIGAPVNWTDVGAPGARPAFDEPVDAEFTDATAPAHGSIPTSVPTSIPPHPGEIPAIPPRGPAAEPPPDARTAERAITRAEDAWKRALPPWLRVVTPVHVGPPARELVMVYGANSPGAQSFRTMRHRIEQDANLQVIGVVSARAGEGKSVMAANLALALAEGGRVNVLLIDGALRTPAATTLFGLGNTRGLTSVLAPADGVNAAAVEVVSVADGLCVLPAGPKVASAHAVLASERAARLLGALRTVFRYIVVDTSAVFGTAETLAWHGMIDRYVLVARQGMTTTDDLGRAADRLHRDKILGVSLVGVGDG